jgi:hypothetical protein
MKTTRVLLLALGGFLATAALAAVFLTVSIPVAQMFEYATGTLVITGLLTIQLGTERTPARPTAHSAAPRPAPRVHRPAARRTLVHAL